MAWPPLEGSVSTAAALAEEPFNRKTKGTKVPRGKVWLSGPRANDPGDPTLVCEHPTTLHNSSPFRLHFTPGVSAYSFKFSLPVVA